MKSIGFRSSILSTWDGAEVIIPNGDLLNAHLINWTMGNPRRRVDIVVGVSYGTDLQLATQIVTDLLKRDDRIYKYPAPIVLVTDFNHSSIDLKAQFWVHHILDMWPIKSDMIVAIDVAFKENGIVIPFPQHDLHIYSNLPEIVKDSEIKDLNS
jgi:small-conductance mechanosensitive channel